MNRTVKSVLSVILAVVMLFSLNVFSLAADLSQNEKPFEDSEFFTDGDYSIHYRVIPAVGERKGRILFIHGFLYSGSTWNSMASEISAAGYDCVLADLPDFGYSTRETFDTQYISRESLMVDLMESIAPLSEWIVAGHSMGGGIAANIASSHPELKALMMYAPAVQREVSPLIGKMAGNDKLMNSAQKIANAVLSVGLVVKLAVGYTSGDWSYGLKYDASIFSDPLKIDGTMRGMCIQYARSEQTDMSSLGDINMPVLLVWGSDDNVLSSGDISSFSTVLDGKAQTHYVDGGHIFIESQSHKTADITLGFLSEFD